MKFYNTLSRKLETFQPITPKQIKLYTCGPTVYDFAQLGNLRSFVFDDTLRRTLAAGGYNVTHVMNITDVGHLTSDTDEGEDKLEAGASRERKPVQEIAEFYIKAFENDMAELNVWPPNGYRGPHRPYARATDFIADQLDVIQRLIDKKIAYVTKQAIYFDVRQLDDYGKLTGQKLEEKETAARPEVFTDSNKRHAQDFALWFFKTGRFAKHSLSWPSPWGEGFPGWHLECSAIIHATIGEPIDIHTGGVDHIGTHHTNEIAQTEAAFGKPLANYWLHNEFLLVDGQRMGKSLGNFLTLADVKQKGFEPLALRLLFLQAHYRSQLNFTWASLKASQTFLRNLQAWADLKFQPAAAKPCEDNSTYQRTLKKMRQALADDLNSAAALSALSALVTESEEGGICDASFQEFLSAVDQLLGLGLSDRPGIGNDAKALLSRRQQARQDQDWALSDKLRSELLDKNLEVKDTSSGQIWRWV